MKPAYLACAFLLSGCATHQYAYLDLIQSGTAIEGSLYSAEVPRASPDDTRQWERYRRDGKPGDLVLKHSEGTVLPSYAASIEVRKRVAAIGSLDDLKKHVARYPEYPHPAEFPTSQPGLLCVRPAVWIDAAPEKPNGFFAHTLLCVDAETDLSYDLKVSYMTARKGEDPPDDLAGLADHFFERFRVKR
ncbi:MAG TPA: hypothetical protein VGD18_06845 [Thiobacillaceae bacterium]